MRHVARGVLNPDLGRRRFRHALHAPADDLREMVDRHWVVEWDLRGRESHTQDVLPHPCVNLAFESSGRAGVYGIPAAVFTREISGAGSVVGTRLRPGALSVLSDVRADALTNAVLPLTEVLGDDGRALEEAVMAADGAAARIEVVETFLRARRRPLGPGARLAQAATDAMLRAPLETTVAELAGSLGVSPRTLQRTFRRHVGVGPKWVLLRYRIHEAAERIAADPGLDLAGLAAELGYADQVHLSADFAARVGRAPGAYAAAVAAS